MLVNILLVTQGIVAVDAASGADLMHEGQHNDLTAVAVVIFDVAQQLDLIGNEVF